MGTLHVGSLLSFPFIMISLSCFSSSSPATSSGELVVLSLQPSSLSSLSLSLFSILFLYLSLSLSLFQCHHGLANLAAPTNERRHAPAKPTQTTTKWQTSAQWRSKRSNGGAWQSRESTAADHRSLTSWTMVLGPNRFLSISLPQSYPSFVIIVHGSLACFFVQK